MDREIEQLILEGKKIEAIKRYRERTGVSLKEAKDAVDAIERGEDPSDLPPAGSAAEPELVQEVVDRLIREGQKIEAIKVMRENSTLGLKEAKDAVDARARELGVESGRSGCFLATAAFGSALAPEVETLRRFRDRRLRRSGAGRRFIRLYYRLSPPVARGVAQSAPLRSLTRVLLRPILALARSAMSGGGT